MKTRMEAETYLGKKDSRPIENNTRVERRGAGNIAIKYHNTDIVVYRPDGTIVVNSGGWHTPTTKDRINRYAGLRIWQSKSIWYIDQNLIFVDNGIINPDGSFTGFEKYTESKAKAQRKLFKQIKDYCDAYMEKMRSGTLGAPSGGDCWYCYMKTEDGKALGDISHSDHILSHIKEKYYVPSLIVNAMKGKLAPFHTWVLGASFNYKNDSKAKEFIDNIKKKDYAWHYIHNQLYRYIKAQLGYAK